MNHVHECIAGRCLVTRSQDKRYSRARVEQLILEEVEMQLSMDALVKGLFLPNNLFSLSETIK